MKTILHEEDKYIIRFERGEEVIASLKQFCQEEQIGAGFFYVLGACDYLKLAYYHLPQKKYIEKEFHQDLEIANVTGDIAMADDAVVVHMHGVFSNEAMATFAGHVMALRVGVTCEMFLTKFTKPMTRELDPEVGLKLLK